MVGTCCGLGQFLILDPKEWLQTTISCPGLLQVTNTSTHIKRVAFHTTSKTKNRITGNLSPCSSKITLIMKSRRQYTWCPPAPQRQCWPARKSKDWHEWAFFIQTHAHLAWPQHWTVGGRGMSLRANAKMWDERYFWRARTRETGFVVASQHEHARTRKLFVVCVLHPWQQPCDVIKLLCACTRSCARTPRDRKRHMCYSFCAHPHARTDGHDEHQRTAHNCIHMRMYV